MMRIISGSKGSHCLYPFQIDPYYNGCKHACKYCYAASLARSMGFKFDEYKETDVKLLETRLKSPRGQFGEFIKRKHPIRIGGMSDPFMRGMDVKKTAEVLDILNQYEYPYIILTKSEDIVKYINHLDTELAQIQISASSSNWKLIEPRASSVSKRLEACEILSDAGIHVIGRIAPIIPCWPDNDEEWSEENEICDGVDFALPLKFELAGARGLILEMIRLTPIMRTNLESAGININATITDKCIKKNGTIYYSLETRQRYYDALSYTDLPVTYCDADLWNTSINGDCCQYERSNNY